MLDIIQKLVACSPRQGPGEILAYEFIKKYLERENISFVDQICPTVIPITKSVSLSANGKSIECKGTGMSSGEITNLDTLISSMLDSDDEINLPNNINFNPRNDESISQTFIYAKAGIAIHKKDVSKLLEAKQIHGNLEVERYAFDSHNILVGNIQNPKSLIFTHYDGWGMGAADNASGVAVCLDIIKNHPTLLGDVLFVIAGNEEVSYDLPTYWAKGYRQFQDKYSHLLDTAENIVIIDSVGFSPTEVTNDAYLINQAFPINNMDHFLEKTHFFCGDYYEMMKFYHSDSDTIEKIIPSYLEEARDMMLEFLEKN